MLLQPWHSRLSSLRPPCRRTALGNYALLRYMRQICLASHWQCNQRRVRCLQRGKSPEEPNDHQAQPCVQQVTHLRHYPTPPFSFIILHGALPAVQSKAWMDGKLCLHSCGQKEHHPPVLAHQGVNQALCGRVGKDGCYLSETRHSQHG